MRLSLFFIAVAATLSWPTTSLAAKLVLITRGDSFSHLGELRTKNQPVQLAPHGGMSVGFKYSYVGVFWLDLWRYDGEYCLYRDKEYVPIPKELAATFMDVKEDEISEPFFYHLPPGLIIVGVLVVFGVGAAIAKQIRKQKVMSLVTDPRYRQALDVFRQQVDANEAAKQAAAEKNEPPPENPPIPWEAAMDHLVASGIERPEAEQNFGKVLGFAVERAAEQAKAEGAG
jgi:hypothetical protein